MGLQITPEMVSRHAVVPASSRQVCEVIVTKIRHYFRRFYTRDYIDNM